MRNIALTFLGCFTILAACSNSDDAEKPVTPVPTGDVTIYATTSSLTRDLTRDAVNFSSKDNLAPTSITLNPTEQYQTMDGFGAAITGATCFNLLQMKPEDRHAFLTETFSDDKGFGFSYIRISIGCSDFSRLLPGNRKTETARCEHPYGRPHDGTVRSRQAPLGAGT